MSAAEALVRVEGLTRRYGSLVAVRDAAFDVNRGEMFGLIGPDGAGKTTTLRVILGLLAPHAGSVRTCGLDPWKEGASLSRKIGYLSQRFSLYTDLSVDENVTFFAEIHGVRGWRARRDELLEMLRMTPFRARLAGRLSGGMKQKLALACTLIHTPELLVLDEPTTGVDPVSRRDFWKILARLQREGLTLLLTTPYLDEAERCQRVALMDQGQVLTVSTPDALRAGAAGVVIEMIVHPKRRAVEVLQKQEGGTDVQAFGERLHVTVANADASQAESVRRRLMTELEGAGVVVEEARAITPSLEDVFIARMQERASPEQGGAVSRPPEPPSRGQVASNECGAGRECQRFPSPTWRDRVGGRQNAAPVVVDSGSLPLRGEGRGSMNTSVRMPNVIEVEHLVKRFGSFTAVNDLSFTVGEGEVFGLLGSNGAGKSTAIRMLCALLTPSAGSARVLGLDVGRDAEALKWRIGYMTQRFSLYEDLTVVQNLEFFGGVYGLHGRELADRKAWALDTAGLLGKEDLLTRSLPGGWKQRLALACSVLHRPRVVFLDEPTGGVDPLSRRRFWTLIDSMAGEGVTLIVTTHYLDEAERCDRIALMHAGRLVALGTGPRAQERLRRPDAARGRLSALSRGAGEPGGRRRRAGSLRFRHAAPRRGRRSRRRPPRRPGAPRAGGQRAGHDRAHRPVARGRLHPPDRGRGRGPAADRMTIRKIWAVARKELRQASRDPLTLTMLLGVPTMMLLLYGYAINFDVRHVRLAVQDLDKSAAQPDPRGVLRELDLLQPGGRPAGRRGHRARSPRGGRRCACSSSRRATPAT